MTRGARLAAFFWIQSMVRDDARRALLFEMDNAIQRLNKDVPSHQSVVQLTGVYHKTHLQTHDRQFDAGQSLPVFESPWGPLGVMICADRRWPETARVLRLQGARLILCPSDGMAHEANEWWMRTRAYENDCFIAFAHPRTSFVADPAGNLAGRLVGAKGDVLAIDIDLERY